MYGQAPQSQYNFDNVQQHPPPSSYMRQPTAQRGPAPVAGRMPTGMRMGTTSSKDRPMSSTAGAGFPSSAGGRKPFDPLGQAGSVAKGPTPTLQKPGEKSQEEQYRQMEKEANTLMEKSAECKLNGELTKALDFAKEAAQKERLLRKQREQAGMLEQINIDLTYAVCFNLANMYQMNTMYQDALNTYSLIVRNKQYPQAGRLRVNMGNIYFSQKKYSAAIKMYRMALDVINAGCKHMKFQIMSNIGVAFVKLGQYHDAVESFESILQGEPTFQNAFNLLLCYFALGDKDKMKKAFTQLLNIEILGVDEEEEEEDKSKKLPSDPLRDYIKDKRKSALKYITDAAKLIAPIIEADWIRGYDWIIEAMRTSEFAAAESEIEIHKAVQYMKQKNFERAIEVFKNFEKKDKHLMAQVATNISFLYFIEKDYRNAEKYADVASAEDRYNAKALVNKGNCFFMKADYASAKEYYLEAIGVEADCVEAIYNLGLVNKRIGMDLEALQAYEKLHTLMPNAPEVIYQIAAIYEKTENYASAIKWYNILITKVPSEPGVLLKIGKMYGMMRDENQAFHYYNESYRHYPVSLDAISWLGAFYAKSEMYEKALTFFERAAQIQPHVLNWKLMVASCYRRMGSFDRALGLFELLHQENPDNVDCLTYLVQACKEAGQSYDQYVTLLNKLLREKSMQAPAAPQQDPDPYSSAPQAEMVTSDIRGLRGGKQVAVVKQQDEDEWAKEANMDELLP